MIISCSISDMAKIPLLEREFHELRARVFRDIMGWDVQVDGDGCERDQFDVCRGQYLCAVDADYKIQAGMRILPTTGPYMAADVFGQLLESNEPLRVPTIWEASRFFARPRERQSAQSAKAYWAGQVKNPYVPMLISGLILQAEAAGVTEVIGVFDVAVERFLRSLGLRSERLGSPQTVGNTRAVAGIFDVKLAYAEAMAEKFGFDLDAILIEAGGKTSFNAINNQQVLQHHDRAKAVNG